MQIRAAQSGDAQAISTLISTLSAKYIAASCRPGTRQKLLETMSPEAIRQYLQRGYLYHVGEIDAHLVGVVGTRHHTHIHHLFVAETQHGNGYASRLWAQVRAAGQQGEITVNASPYAYAIYRHWGFLPNGERRDSDGIIDIPMRWDPAQQRPNTLFFLPDAPPA